MANLSQTHHKVAKVWFPAKLQPLFRPSRYKILRGGRGGSKSWGVARALILIANKSKKRILCTREFQNSIAESVHRLLEEQINALGLARNFLITEKSIYCVKTGSEFIFAGLRRDITKIKSTEGVDICWVEEAEKVSNRSWEILIPTIRKAGSEIWVTFNPDDEKDPTWQRFGANTPPDSIVIEINWADNPWLPEELRKEKDYLYSVDTEAAAHVWGGELNKRSDAQIFKGKFVIEDFEPDSGWNGPYYGQDFGFSTDPAATTKSWFWDNTVYIEKEAVGYSLKNDELNKLIRAQMPEIQGYVIRADCSRPETIAHMNDFGLLMQPCKKWTGCVEDGIQWLRSRIKVVIHPRCKNQAQEARLYKYKVDPITGDVLPIIVDKHNHGWDSVRYAFEPMIMQNDQSFVHVDDSNIQSVRISPDLDEVEQAMGDVGFTLSNW